MDELRDLEELIDALDRPWAPQENDRLRAHFHAARRDPTGHAARELKEAIDHCMRGLSPEDLRYVIERRAKKKGNTAAEVALVFIADIATEVVAHLIRSPRRRHHRRHRRGR